MPFTPQQIVDAVNGAGFEDQDALNEFFTVGRLGGQKAALQSDLNQMEKLVKDKTTEYDNRRAAIQADIDAKQAEIDALQPPATP